MTLLWMLKTILKMEMTNKPQRTFILGGTVSQAYDYARHHGIKDFVAIDSINTLRGLRKILVIMVGSYYERSDYDSIEDQLQSIEATVKVA